MKSLLMAALLVLTISAAAQSPDPPRPAPRAALQARRLERLAILLDLDDGQKAQVQTVLQQQHAKASQFFQQQRASGTRPTREQMQAAHDQMLADTLQKLAMVLTPAQLNKFRVLHAKSRFIGPHPEGPPDAPPGAPPVPTHD